MSARAVSKLMYAGDYDVVLIDSFLVSVGTKIMTKYGVCVGWTYD
jgi:hypothetical protein